MWWKRREIDSLRFETRENRRLIYQMLEDKYLGKNVRSGSATFKVEHVSIDSTIVFLHGGKENQLFSFEGRNIGLPPRPYKEWSIVVNAKDVEICE